MANYDLLVIGTGPDGQKAAVQAAKLGKKVGIIEKKEVVGGVCINTGTIPSKSLREAVLYLSGFRQRNLYGAGYRVKNTITIEDLVFTTPTGTPVDHRNDYRRWKALLAKAGVRDVRLHDARHTTITLLAQAGVSRGTIAMIVGHDDPAFTERVYTHIDLDAARQATVALESIFAR
jgi:integrase